METSLSMTVSDLQELLLGSYANFCQFFQEDGWFDPTHEKLCNWLQFHLEENLRKGIEEWNPEENTEPQFDDLKITLTMPRGSLKTTIFTQYFPLWITLRAHYKKFPADWLPFIESSLRTLIVTNTHPNARSKINGIKAIIHRKEFQIIFPDVLPQAGQRTSSDCYELNLASKYSEGTFEGAGTGTQKIGMHYNVILEDDTVAPDESEMEGEIGLPSRERIEQGIGYHKLSTALLVPKGFRVRIVVSTRWGEDDLLAYIWKNEKGYKVFDVSAIEGADVDNWEEGRPVFSMFYPREKLREIENDLGPFLFACLYLNKPQDASLRKFRDEWLRNIITPAEVPEVGSISISIDPAISEKEEACETSITVVLHVLSEGRIPYQYWLEDYTGHLDPEETITFALNLAEKYDPLTRGIVVETVAYQKALKTFMFNEMAARGKYWPIFEFASRTHKATRIEGMLVPLFKSGRIFLVDPGLSKDHRGNIRVISQLKAFPTGKLIDIADAFSMHGKLTPAQLETPIVHIHRLATESGAPTFEQVVEQIKKARQFPQGSLARFYESNDPNSSRNMRSGHGLLADLAMMGIN